ncbi:biopolymer transporter ExbD [Candidatus Sumerlaeota bacterium]|nr:biopolymer transporter ExbD [Candidatus Sumerlaeota bacterium]
MSQPLAAINVTPMLDVMCKLLIVFMMFAPALQRRGLRLDLPRVENAPPITTARKVFTISIEKGDTAQTPARFYLEQADGEMLRVDMEELRTQLEILRRRYGSNLDIVIEPDRQVPCEPLLQIIQVTKEVGLESVGIRTVPEKEKR